MSAYDQAAARVAALREEARQHDELAERHRNSQLTAPAIERRVAALNCRVEALIEIAITEAPAVRSALADREYELRRAPRAPALSSRTDMGVQP